MEIIDQTRQVLLKDTPDNLTAMKPADCDQRAFSILPAIS